MAPGAVAADEGDTRAAVPGGDSFDGDGGGVRETPSLPLGCSRAV